MFRAIARGRRHRSGALEVSAAVLDAPNTPPRVAFAVGRPVGNAVVRNQVRRRLRAATREHLHSLRPGWGYLVRATPKAADASYGELSGALCASLRAFRDDAS